MMEELKGYPIHKRFYIYILIIISFFDMLWQIYRHYQWMRIIDEIKIEPKIHPKDRKWKYN